MSRFGISGTGLHALEHRVPPPVVALLVAAGMWLGVRLWPAAEMGLALRLGLVAAFGLPAAAFGVLGFRAFGRAKTTIDPVRVDRASTLVTTGVYAWTRNPMYVGMTLLLCSWAAYLGTPWAAAGPLAFAAFIGRFQIAPEERALRGKFGQGYERYCRQVRRWI